MAINIGEGGPRVFFSPSPAVKLWPNADQGLLILEDTRSQTATHHSR